MTLSWSLQGNTKIEGFWCAKDVLIALLALCACFNWHHAQVALTPYSRLWWLCGLIVEYGEATPTSAIYGVTIPEGTVLLLLYSAYWSTDFRILWLWKHNQWRMSHTSLLPSRSMERTGPFLAGASAIATHPLLSAATNTVTVPYLPTHFFCSSPRIA